MRFKMHRPPPKKKKSTLNIFSPLKFTSWRPSCASVVKNECAQLGVSCAQSGATAPTILEAGNMISQDMLRHYFKKEKVTIQFGNFS